MKHAYGFMYGKNIEMRDEIVKERLGLGNTNSSPNSNRKQFWPVGRFAPTPNSIDRDERGET